MRISVCITSYNQRRYLAEAIESALAQTLPPFQVVVVDDCSTDGSQDVIAGFHSQHPGIVAPIYHVENSGVARARIHAAQAVGGDFVTYLDADDRFLPTKLEKEVAALQRSAEAQIAFSDFYYIGEDGTRIGRWAEDDEVPEGDVFCQTFARDFPKQTLFRSELVNYEAWRQVGFHNPMLCLYEDYDMRIRLTRNLRAVYSSEPLSEYRLHTGGLSRMELARHFEALRYVYHKNVPLLSHLSRVDREYAKRGARRFIAQVARQASEEALDQDQRLQAARLVIAAGCWDPAKRDWRSLFRILGPRAVF